MRWPWQRARAEEPPPVASRVFVGREEEVALLQQNIEAAALGRLGIVLLEGVQGMGKEALLGALLSRVRQERPEAHAVEVYCYQATGSQDPFGPLAESLQLLAQHEKRDLAREAMAIIREHGTDLLALVPGIGPSLTIAAKVGMGMVGRALSRDEARARWEHLPSQFEQTLAVLASQFRPLVLVIKEAQWIDERSVQVLHRLARRPGESRLVVVCSATPLSEDHLLRALEREGLAVARELGPLGVQDVERYVLARYGLPLSADLAGWLHAWSEGKPLYVEEYLDLLEEEGVIRMRDGRPELAGELSLVQRRLPQDVADVLRQRIGRLDGDERKLMQLAAIHGQQFLSATLADLRGEEELEVVARLEEIEREHRLVSFSSVERSADKRSALYAFDSGIQPTLYETVSRYRRMVLHRGVGESLERFLEGEGVKDQPPRKWVLEIARHYRDAEEPLPAARRYLQAAQSAYGVGGFKEAADICREALVLLRNLPEGVEGHDRLRAEVIQLLLDASADAWQPGDQPDHGVELVTLADEAEAAASRVGDLRLQAHVRYARGRIVFWIGRLRDALAVLQEALSIAEQSGDGLTQVMVMSDLGHHLNSLDLAAGSEMLRRAHDLYAGGKFVVDDWWEEQLLRRHGSRLKGRIGVAEFDQGHYGEAERWLTEAISEFREIGVREELEWFLNFGGQLWTASGRFEQAKEALEEAVSMSRPSGSAASSYHLALLGRAYLEWDGRVSDAEQPVAEAFATVPGSEVNDIALLVRNVRAEYLLARGNDDDVLEALTLLERVVEEGDSMGSDRAAIAARSLLARAALHRGDLERASQVSTQAVETLSAKRWFVPTVRTEEVLFAHHTVLAAIGRTTEAEAHLRHAAHVLKAKAQSISQAYDRRAFLERVALSRQITAAMAGIQ
jgi:tetratricopeptide (TPR) repeat protein